MNKSLSLVLIEDEQADVSSFKRALKDINISAKIETYFNSEEAIVELKKKQKPDLIILDLNLPGKGGMWFIKSIKENTELNTIPVIVFTSSDSDQDIVKCYELGISSYIKKPLDYETLKRVIGKLIDFWLNVATLPS